MYRQIHGLTAFYKFIDTTTPNSTAIYKSNDNVTQFKALSKMFKIFNMSVNLLTIDLIFYNPEMTINLDSDPILRIILSTY